MADFQSRLLSVSRRTDIPAFFTPWFQNRLREGYCRYRNPFSGKMHEVSLQPEHVLGWVFWSRNYGDFFPVLDALQQQGQRFLCHFTILGYPPALEPRTPPLEKALCQARKIAERFGPKALQWRYDPILLTSLTSPDWHRRQFEIIATALDGAVQRCHFSFPTWYQKTRRNLESRCREQAFRVWKRGEDFDQAEQERLLRDLVQMAAVRGIRLHACCCPDWINPAQGVFPGQCCDWELLQEMGAGLHWQKLNGGSDLLPPPLPALSRRPTRKGCHCHHAIDIGAYNSCAHGCAYCYAVENPAEAHCRLESHDPARDFL